MGFATDAFALTSDTFAAASRPGEFMGVSVHHK